MVAITASLTNVLHCWLFSTMLPITRALLCEFIYFVIIIVMMINITILRSACMTYTLNITSIIVLCFAVVVCVIIVRGVIGIWMSHVRSSALM